ncbi:MAG: DUF5916 domain-containing protein, partial [Ignavibacteria bacterium]|nr:DUF5916 domain-containing protein [Ignavibacteria bacterium]
TEDKKTLTATFITEAITIDGKLDETIWQKSAIASQFTQIEPYNGKAASLETKVYILFDERAVYIGAYIIDPNPDSISIELRSRDNAGTADAFMVKIDPYNDGLLAYGFEVTASGVQIDMKTNSNNNDDLSWDAVWKSQTEILADGWSVEMMIPYSALRFPKSDTQTWGINFYRTIQRFRETTSWNFIDVKSKSSINQSGQLIINEVITPPLRLSATPYLSAITSHNSATNKWSNGYNYGMDMKLGLTESFTLDLTMIPDFGQVESDEIIYSLSPFEVYYDEKRPFFTEGTELFSKGNVFYSKRIGATPDGYQQVNESYEPDEIKSNPANAQLINAAKLSGKTSDGLAIGVFNALTANTYAKVVGIEGIEKKILTEPLTNFNMLVFEQALPNNSQVSIYNTNVFKPETNYIADVSGTDFGLRDRKNNYEFSGMLNVSQHYLPGISPEYGSRMVFDAAKINGNFQADTWIN